MGVRPEDIKPEPVRPIHIRVCVQCEKDEMLIVVETAEEYILITF